MLYLYLKKIKKIYSGFTLVELLVVIAIIGIISTVAVVNLRSAKDNARDKKIIGVLDSFRDAVSLCFHENEPLRCGPVSNFTCNGRSNNGIPTADQVMCRYSINNWLNWNNQGENDVTWYRANSDPGAGTFCFEVRKSDPLYVNVFYGCTQNGCLKRYGSICSVECRSIGQACDINNPCCVSLACISGTCAEPPVDPGDSGGGGSD